MHRHVAVSSITRRLYLFLRTDISQKKRQVWKKPASFLCKPFFCETTFILTTKDTSLQASLLKLRPDTAVLRDYALAQRSSRRFFCFSTTKASIAGGSAFADSIKNTELGYCRVNMRKLPKKATAFFGFKGNFCFQDKSCFCLFTSAWIHDYVDY